MYRKALFFALMIVVAFAAKAQKGSNQLKLIVEAPLPVYQHDFGAGGFIKYMHGIGKSSQLTITAGVSGFGSSKHVENGQTHTRLIPVLAGYRYSLHKFYIEPQAGYGELGGRINLNGDYARPSVGAFFWAVGAGYNSRRFDVGLRFQSASGAEGAEAGLWHNKNFHYTGVYAGINLF